MSTSSTVCLGNTRPKQQHQHDDEEESPVLPAQSPRANNAGGDECGGMLHRIPSSSSMTIDDCGFGSASPLVLDVASSSEDALDGSGLAIPPALCIDDDEWAHEYAAASMETSKNETGLKPIVDEELYLGAFRDANDAAA
eukprot:CAMPEP_0174849592 /NCGR_PEP_ID=MMETSP1114-20130205/16655_1 /TAXON_ID=312471 /ORGANISM="Neobodo designis, Strain CCAP 1951/1" /LENGTH=139 /DNA_ID=CAMNT_0016083967 /DNA_START=213 /DNA_END=628 /DNA_ORIENTATION=+